jgi:hypothetical protein
VYRTVLADLRGGGTILLHDSDVAAAPGSWRSTLGALPHVLDHCRNQGLAVGPLGEHRPSRSGSCGRAGRAVPSAATGGR